jgi:predicted small lipoprotein YifL
MKTVLRMLLIAALLMLAACGNKGQLVLPDKAASPAAPDTPASPASPASSASPAG